MACSQENRTPWDHDSLRSTERFLLGIEGTRADTLSALLKLFNEVKSLFESEQKEVAAILSLDRRTIAVSVDSAISIKKLPAFGRNVEYHKADGRAGPSIGQAGR
jgi:hypothetical protein